MKERILYGIILILCMSTAVFAYKYYSTRPIYAKFRESPKLDNAAVPPIAVYHDTQGVEHKVFDADVNKIIADEKGPVAAKIEPIIDQLAEDLSVKSKQIESSSTISTEIYLKDTKFLEKQIDSLKRLTYSYRDKYLTLDVRPAPNGIDLPSFDFKYNADLNITQYWKKTWFLGAKHSVTDISSTDPRVTIKGLKTFTVIQKQPTLGLRLQAVGGYALSSDAFFLGPSIRFDIKNISFRGSYFYNTITKQWSPNIAAEYNIIKF